ncbi:MAG: hypothetical protein JW808_01500 [Victivallales bacterium]|nr:hypothetical protein [Victivallales bacterium]
MKKRAIFLVKSEKTPSSRIRVCNLLPHLERRGVEAHVEYIPNSLTRRFVLFKKCADFDLVFLQKRLFSFFEFRELRRRSMLLAFDFDDAIYLKNKSPSEDFAEYQSATRKRRFKRTVKAADLVLLANKVLCDETLEYIPVRKIRIVPSAVDLSGLEVKRDYGLSSPPVVGWVGTRGTQRYLDYISGALRELRGRHDFVLRVISDQDYMSDGLQVENVRWSRESESLEISKFDIGIMPLSKDPFSEGKAAYKLLQYMACAVPSVVSGVGMNVEVAAGGEYALCAYGSGQFGRMLGELVENCEIRKRLGRDGRDLVEREYSTDVVGEKFADALMSIL